jgi:DSS1/SEM1 family
MDPWKKGAAVDEDDEFDDFNVDTWASKPLDMENMQLWDSSWDDEGSTDAVTQQLRKRLTDLKVAKEQPATTS